MRSDGAVTVRAVEGCGLWERVLRCRTLSYDARWFVGQGSTIAFLDKVQGHCTLTGAYRPTAAVPLVY